MRTALLAALVLLGPAAAALAQKPASPPPATDKRKVSPLQRTEFCSLLQQCGLKASATCTPAESAGAPGVTYDEERCRDARALTLGGLGPDSDVGFRTYRFLGRKYRVVYEETGVVPISPERVMFLLDELPFAARLLSAYQDTKYEAEWLDGERKRFRAAKGDTLTGDAQLVAGGPRSRVLYYFGRGRSKLGPWKLAGVSLFRFDFWPIAGKPREIGWKARVIAAPENAFVNMIMNMSLFRGQVLRHLREVVQDMTKAAHELDKSGTALPPGQWSADDRARIEALRALP
jgi:hypothetical protein